MNGNITFLHTYAFMACTGLLPALTLVCISYLLPACSMSRLCYSSRFDDAYNLWCTLQW